MWVLMNDAALSIVAHRDLPDKLMVRARFEGDIKRVFPGAAVEITPDADYLYRAVFTRTAVADVLAARVDGIDYPNFKNSVAKRFLHDLYLEVWFSWRSAQRFGRR